MKWMIYALSFFTMITGCKQAVEIEQQADNEKQQDMDWRQASIYEVNLRQYTPEGTFKAFANHIDDIADLGVKIIWFMPLQEIGVKNRKGGRGSYYSIKDYKSINHEFGSAEDFARVVDMCHDRGMMVILDWVANHSAWDNVWVNDHPDFYSRNDEGKMYPPVEDWSDVVDLNYDNPVLRDSMTAAMQHWVDAYNIDGFRCDVAHMVPTDYWKEAINSLRKSRPLFMLAESEEDELYGAEFDMLYGWNLHHIFNKIAREETSVKSIVDYYKDAKNQKLKMLFTSNHDENSWNKDAITRMGDAYENMIAASFTLPGMPLVYSGQESGMNKSLEFFEKDTILWVTDSPYRNIFKRLVHLKSHNPALSNDVLKNISFLDAPEGVLAYSRKSGGNEVVTILNMNTKDVSISLKDIGLKANTYSESINGELFPADEVTIGGNHNIILYKNE